MHILKHQLKSPLNYLLALAAVITFWGSNSVDSFIIFIFLIIRVGINFYQEWRVEKTLTELKIDEASNDFQSGAVSIGRFFSKFIALGLVLFFFANLAIKGPASTAPIIIFFLILTVMVLPESLSLFIRFALARGARNLNRKGVRVRSLNALEHLGGIEILCTDKTGTLTENALVVAEINAIDPNLALLISSLAGSNSDSFDQALWERLPEKEKGVVEKSKRLAELPFNSEERRNLVVVEIGEGRWLVSRGAPEAILPICLKPKNQSPEMTIALTQWIAGEGRRGRRVIAVARKRLTKKIPFTLLEWKKFRNGFELIGAISFLDQIKPGVAEVITHADTLGIKIKMITGDSAEVAGAVATSIGLTTAPDQVVTGDYWEAMSAHEQWTTLERIPVFARVSPEQRTSIIATLNERYRVGLAGEITGVQIANGQLKAILETVEQGRKVIANTTKYTIALLVFSLGNFMSLTITSLFIPSLPLASSQILLFSLLTNIFFFAFINDRLPQSVLMKPAHYHLKDLILRSLILSFIWAIFLLILFGLFSKLTPPVFQTNWFIASLLMMIVLGLLVRSAHSIFVIGRPSWTFIILALLIIFFAFYLPSNNLGQEIFGFSTMKPQQTAMIVYLSIIFLTISETIKMFYENLSHRNEL